MASILPLKRDEVTPDSESASRATGFGEISSSGTSLEGNWHAAADYGNYEHSLRQIGRELDQRHLQLPTIYETSNAFVTRALSNTSRLPVILHHTRMTADELAERSQSPGDGPYERLLRTLGAQLDAHQARFVVITEGVNFIAMNGQRPHENGVLTPFEVLLLQSELSEIMATNLQHRPLAKAATNPVAIVPQPQTASVWRQIREYAHPSDGILALLARRFTRLSTPGNLL